MGPLGRIMKGRQGYLAAGSPREACCAFKRRAGGKEASKRESGEDWVSEWETGEWTDVWGWSASGVSWTREWLWWHVSLPGWYYRCIGWQHNFLDRAARTRGLGLSCPLVSLMSSETKMVVLGKAPVSFYFFLIWDWDSSTRDLQARMWDAGPGALVYWRLHVALCV